MRSNVVIGNSSGDLVSGNMYGSIEIGFNMLVNCIRDDFGL